MKQFLIFTLVLVLSGCTLLKHDDREKVAFNTLVNSDGVFDSQTLTGAINSRFPEGTNISEFYNYIKSINGECTVQSKGSEVICTLAVESGVCWSKLIQFDLLKNKDKIKSIKAQSYSTSC